MAEKPAKCSNCGSEDISDPTPFVHKASNVAQGRLRTNEHVVKFSVGCNNCSETLQILGENEVKISHKKEETVQESKYSEIPENGNVEL